MKTHVENMERLSPARFLWERAKHYRSFMIQAVISILMMALINLPMPLLNKVVIDYLIPGGTVRQLLFIGLLAFVARSMAAAFQVLQNYVVRRVTTGIGHQLRSEMMGSMLGAPYSRFVPGEIAGYVGRLSSDVSRVEMLLFETIAYVVRPMGMLLVMLAAMWLLYWPMAILLMLMVPLSVFTTRKMNNRLSELEREVLEQLQAMNREMTEILDNIRVIRCFTREDHYQNRIEDRIHGITEASVQLATRQRLVQLAIDVIYMAPWLVVVLAGGWMVRENRITLGDFMAFMTFEQLLRSPLSQLAYYLLKIRAEMVGTDRVQEVISLDSDRTAGRDLKKPKGEIVFQNLSFSYLDGSPVLHQMNERAAPGERIGIVGPSGAGKSTLVNLLLGFYSPSAGTILIDGVPIQEIGTESLRRNTGVVFQDNPMFDASIRSNLLLGEKGIRDEQLWEALEQANVADFVRSLPDTLETLVGVKGLKLSGGQRQRLAIARVILKSPSIVIMDEATSSLDSVTELQIEEALEHLLENRTSITIAHRLSTIVRSDRILYLEDGRIMESGTHGELIKQKARYHALYEAQTEGLLADR
ncbi:MAG: ABC transporter ATP-binding protein [Planctomycetota bacterium]|jgi:ABC-type multidrug transport system fused ATPase/permease subunit|nr:ABC transporter ATP-binding protein [Planctomycetota bacterium]